MNPTVTITIQGAKPIVIELYPEIAPNTVDNFISLVKNRFYDGLIFHRVIPQFMIQGGCPNKNGTGGPGYTIKGEFAGNGFVNELKHQRGVISMARAQHPDSAGSQFFIMVANAPHLDGQYAAFGQVISGIETVDAVVSQKRDPMDKPLRDIVISSATVQLQGYQPNQPQVIKR